jgi:hypothetical protein
MSLIRSCWIVFIGIVCLGTAALASTPLVSGNGFGFVVVSPETYRLTKFYAHPYSFVRPDPKDSLSEGIPTANLVKSLGWSEASTESASVDYVDDSHVIVIRSRESTGQVFMPFGLARNALIVAWEPTSAQAHSGHLTVEWSQPVRSQKTLSTGGFETRLLKFDGIDESLLLIPIGKRIRSKKEIGVVSTNSAWAMITLEDEREADHVAQEFRMWKAGLSPDALVKRELVEVERWRVKPPSGLSEKELHLWRQSEILLRAAQSREPNRPGRYGNGMIVAALPDGSWFMTWVRDMAYAALAFARMGHQQEARAALLAYFNARPTGKMKEQTAGVDYQVSVVRYFGDGAEEPFFTNEGNTNIEFDSWGEVLWLLGEYLHRYDDPSLLRTSTYRGPLYESARDYVVKPLLANLEKYGDGEIVAPDTSIWEEHQKDQKHFAFSTAMTIVGLQNFAEIAKRNGDASTVRDLLNHVSLLKKGFQAAFVRDGKVHGTLEEGVKNDIDGALLAIINLGVVTDDALIRSTVDRMELLKVASGGYKRVRGTYTDPAIYEYWYEKQEFLFVDFMLAEVYRNLGRNQEAEVILTRIVDKSAVDHNIVPEMYVAEDCKLFHGAIGDPTGATPMVGYGAGVYILDVLQRAESQQSH